MQMPGLPELLQGLSAQVRLPSGGRTVGGATEDAGTADGVGFTKDEITSFEAAREEYLLVNCADEACLPMVVTVDVKRGAVLASDSPLVKALDVTTKVVSKASVGDGCSFTVEADDNCPSKDDEGLAGDDDADCADVVCGDVINSVDIALDILADMVVLDTEPTTDVLCTPIELSMVKVPIVTDGVVSLD